MKKNLFLMLIVLFLSLTLSGYAFCLTLYDDFSGTYIDKNKWRDAKWAGEIEPANQRLSIKQGSPGPISIDTYPYSASNNSNLSDSNSVVAARASTSQRTTATTMARETFTVPQSQGGAFTGTLSGTWTGKCGNWVDISTSGNFSMTIGANGNVTGSYSGDASGSISGQVDVNGNFTAIGTAGFISWTGEIASFEGSLSGNGTWSGDPEGGSWGFCSGTWYGSGTSCQLTCSAWTEPYTHEIKVGDTVFFKATVEQIGNCSGDVSYNWNFGDGKSDTGLGTDTTHVYGYEGTFNWTVIITVGKTDCVKTGTITISSGCTLVCTATGPTSGDEDEYLNFRATATATNCVTTASYEWKFGDGWTSNLQNPTHSYFNNGVYTWTMTATADDQTCKRSGPITIGSTPPTTLPNLRPYQPKDWSDAIVVSNQTGTTTDSSPLYTTDALYVDWAVINKGSVGITKRFYVSLYVDGKFKKSWYFDSFNANSYGFVKDYSIGQLGAGNHTLTIFADSSGAINESNETDNQYAKTIKVLAKGSSGSLPNLRPYKPKDWSDAIVVSTSKGVLTDSDSYTDEDDLYINWAVLNDGPVATPGGFSVDLYIDGLFKKTWSYSSSLKANYYRSVKDYSIGRLLEGGTHTIDIVVDSDEVISESNEDDNMYTKEIWVEGYLFYEALPNLTPYQPEGWSDKIVVSSSRRNSKSSDSFTPQETLYVDWAVINNGEAGTSQRVSVSLYVDGVLKKTWKIPPLKGSEGEPFSTLSSMQNNYYAIKHYSIGKLGVGDHTLTIVVDPEGAILEDDKGDNEYNKTIHIVENP